MFRADSQLNKQTITNNQSINDIYISNSDIFELLTSLDVRKAYGIDNLSPTIFKPNNICAAPLLQIICHLFHTSISTSIIPCDWRTHCIVPIHKSGDKSSVSDYRPILLLCILSKVLEKVVYNNMWEKNPPSTNLDFYLKVNSYWHLQRKSLNQTVKLML